ncbi:TPA: ATP-binding protein, partial [Vibrio cholerae]|nr:ATP-binding protein [Vibrio cholerae]
KIIKPSGSLTELVSTLADSLSIGKKNVTFELHDVNVTNKTLNQALLSASSNNDFFKDLDVSFKPSSNTKIEAELNEGFLNSLTDKEIQLRLHSDIIYRLIKHKGSNSIELELVKESSTIIDTQTVIMEFSFLLRLFVTEQLFKLRQFPITSERTGIALFNSDLMELNKYKVDEIQSQERYSLPIEINISTYRHLKNRKISYNDWTQKNKPTFQSQIKDIVGGHYDIEDQEVYFRPNGKDLKVPLKSSSGASKSLMLLDYFMYQYYDYGYLIIDEPELNLHLDSQKEIAQVLCSIANQGIKVVVTTHSDHFIREVNNLIMLSNKKLKHNVKQEIMKKAGIRKGSIISADKVSTFVISKNERKAYEMSVGIYGIDLTLFNEEIMKSNDVTQELMSSVYEANRD